MQRKKYTFGKNVYTFHIDTVQKGGSYKIYAGRDILGYNTNDVIGMWKNNAPDIHAQQFARNMINLFN